MFGNAQDVAAVNVRGLAGAAPRLGAMKPRSAPKEFEAEPDSVKDILRELLSERRARKDPEDYADSTAYTAGVKGVEKLENLRRKFREDPEEKHRVMMEKVHAVAPDILRRTTRSARICRSAGSRRTSACCSWRSWPRRTGKTSGGCEG